MRKWIVEHVSMDADALTITLKCESESGRGLPAFHGWGILDEEQMKAIHHWLQPPDEPGLR